MGLSAVVRNRHFQANFLFKFPLIICDICKKLVQREIGTQPEAVLLHCILQISAIVCEICLLKMYIL